MRIHVADHPLIAHKLTTLRDGWEHMAAYAEDVQVNAGIQNEKCRLVTSSATARPKAG